MTNNPLQLTDADKLVQRLSDDLDGLRKAISDEASAEEAYRKEKAKKWLEVGEKVGVGSYAKQREDWVNSQTAELRKARDIARGMKTFHLEAVRSARQTMSLYQSLLKQQQEERSAF